MSMTICDKHGGPVIVQLVNVCPKCLEAFDEKYKTVLRYLHHLFESIVQCEMEPDEYQEMLKFMEENPYKGDE